MRRSQLNALLIGGLVLVTGLGILAGHHFQSSGDDVLSSGLRLGSPRALGEYRLIGDDGEIFDISDGGTRWELVFFGFTHCPDVCPTTLSLLAQVVDRMDPAAPLRIVLASVDGERDTPELLGRYVRHFNPEFRGISADTQELERFASDMSVAFVKVPQGDSYTMDHSTAMVLVNPRREIVAFFPAPHTVDELVHDLALLVRGAGG